MRSRVLTPQELANPNAGNRFDSQDGSYGVLYFGSDLTVCFGETLARFRPSTHIVAVIGNEWDDHKYMKIGAIPADWRARRSAVRVRVTSPGTVFLDAEAPATHRALEIRLADELARLGHDCLDVGVVRGKDRRVTRLISQWAYSAWSEDADVPEYAGVRYLSRINSGWECWAVFDDIDLEIVERKPITLNMPELQGVADDYKLVPF